VRPIAEVEVVLGCRSGLLSIDGLDVPLELGTVSLSGLLDGDPVTAEPCADGSTGLAAGPVDVESASGRSTGLDVDRVVVRSTPTDAAATARPAVELVEHGRLSRTAQVGACPTGCWIVLGEGLNPGWSASVDGVSLGAATLVDGGFHGWWLEPSTAQRSVRFEWGEQRPVTIGLAVSGVAVIACIVVAVVDRRRRPGRLVMPPRLDLMERGPVEWAWWAPALVTGGAALALIGPLWAVAGALIGALAGRLGRPRLLATGAVVVWLAIGAILVTRTYLDQPFPGPGWPGEFATWHRPGVFVLALLAGSLTAPDRRRPVGSISSS
jgi:arabinofuranan 3-O-arabinosyltransferase